MTLPMKSQKPLSGLWLSLRAFLLCFVYLLYLKHSMGLSLPWSVHLWLPLCLGLVYDPLVERVRLPRTNTLRGRDGKHWTAMAASRKPSLWVVESGPRRSLREALAWIMRSMAAVASSRPRRLKWYNNACLNPQLAINSTHTTRVRTSQRGQISTRPTTDSTTDAAKLSQKTLRISYVLALTMRADMSLSP